VKETMCVLQMDEADKAKLHEAEIEAMKHEREMEVLEKSLLWRRWKNRLKGTLLK